MRTCVQNSRRCRAGSDGKGTDWDASWQSFKRSVQSHVETPSSSPPRNTRRPPRSASPPPGLSNAQDRLRQQERGLLDVWSSEGAMGLGMGMAVTLLLVMVSAAGPSLDTSRCTLPWC
ncbi:hypothetical protein V8C86DRAFT_1251904 [Haematococcus lacustris]